MKPKTAKAAPFCSSHNRFAANDSRIEAPGPGSYSMKSLADDVSKRVQGRSGAFGTTEKRYVLFIARGLAAC